MTQVSWKESLRTLPDGHGLQVPDAGLVPMEPRGQELQEDDALFENNPGVQGIQPVNVLYVPAAHGWHSPEDGSTK